MSYAFHIDFKATAAGALAVTASVAAFSSYKWWQHQQMKKEGSDETVASKSAAGDDANVYETSSYLNMFLLFHYGRPSDVIQWDYGPQSALEFPRRCAELCVKYAPKTSESRPYRALDVGCGVGGITFELARTFDHVIGIDWSQSFVDTCNVLRETGKFDYAIVKHGAIFTDLVAVVGQDVDRQRVLFEHGDACQLSPSLGQFDCVLAANLIDRLHTPLAFVDRLESLVIPGGLLVLTCPYTFIQQFTPRKNWIGGWTTDDGTEYSAFDGLRDRLEPHFELVETADMPFYMRETERQYWLNVAHATVWRRRH